MNKKIILLIALMLLIGLITFVSAEENSKFDSITVKFVDALTLDPIVNSRITCYYDKFDTGEISEETYYTTDSNGEIKIPVQGKVHYFRSDRVDNIHYVNQLDLILIDILKEPKYTIFLNPIFDIQIKLKTDFNFLLSFFRMFRYGSYLEAPASQLNTGSNCFMAPPKKGKTIKQYNKIIDIKAYFSRDLNSPTKEPYECSVYAWESIRKVAGIKQIDFTSMKQDQVNKFELPLDMSYEDLINRYPSIRPPESE